MVHIRDFVCLVVFSSSVCLFIGVMCAYRWSGGGLQQFVRVWFLPLNPEELKPELEKQQAIEAVFLCFSPSFFPFQPPLNCV